MADTKKDDATLMRQIAQGQTEALSELYDRYNRLVFSIALTIVDDKAIASEITLDVFTRIWQRAGLYQEEQARATTWIGAITRHHAIDILRYQNARPHLNSLSWDDLSPQAALYSLEEDVELAWQRERVRTAVAQLPAEQQQVLALAFFKGYTHYQIAELLKQPLGTVKSRLRSAMQKLRHTLEGEQPSPDTSKQPLTTYNKDKNE